MLDLDEIKEKADYCLNCGTKPCAEGCPLGNDIPEFIKYIKEEKYKDAYIVLDKTTVLQPICGRICPHYRQCRGECVRGIKGEAVSIGELETFIGDMAIKEGWKISKEIDSKLQGKKVAVVGGGPAGLTCAAFLAKKGVEVTIYEKHEALGGLLRHGIPEFRLEKDLLDKQIKRIVDLGINVVCGKTLGKDVFLEDLKRNFDAVFLAFGANISRKMNVPGEDLKGVFGGNELLENADHPNYNGKKVAVIGGGNVAMDVARTVNRLGADKVFVIYRRAEEQMPAERKEIEDAKAEGIEFLFQNNLVRIIGEAEGVTAVECVKTELVKKEGSSRLCPVDVEGSNFKLDMDFVVMAVGAEVEQGLANGIGVKLNKWGCIEVDKNYETSLPGVYAGGDLAGTTATVAWASRDGRNAAKSICEKLV